MPALLLFLVKSYERLKGKIFSWVDRFIAVSEFVQKQHVLTGFPADKIVVNNNGIDIDGLKSVSSQYNERKGVVFAGRISVAKGSKVLKSLISEITCNFHIIGIGPDLIELQDYCAANNYHHVKFWGHLTKEETLKILGRQYAL